MIRTLYGDILKIAVENANFSDGIVIAHQVNCIPTMGAGLAKKIANTFPEVNRAYLAKGKEEGWQLGDLQIVECNYYPNLRVANLAGQLRVATPTNRVATDLEALRLSLQGLAQWRSMEGHDIFRILFPLGMGCGHGGEDWDNVRPIIEDTMEGFHADCYFVNNKK